MTKKVSRGLDVQQNIVIFALCNEFGFKSIHFFAQSVPIVLALPQAAQLSIFLNRKITSVAPPRGT